jgi:hypothetical protein
MLFVKRIFGVLFNTGFFALLLFPEARTLHWRRAWIFLGVNPVSPSAATT